MTSAYAVYNTSYELRTPYITTAEYNNAPTAMSTDNLVGGSPLSNLIALQETIGRASSWVDQYCCGFSGTLAATVEIENARVWGSYRNTLTVHPRWFPILEVQAFSYSAIPGGLASGGSAASVVPSGSITVYPTEFEVAPTGAIGWGGFGLNLNSAPGGIMRRIEYDCQWQYVVGWVQTTLSASVAAGATSIQPLSVTGLYPGTMLTLYDLPNDEQIQVSQSYVPGSSVVPFANPLQYDHSTTATISNLPPAVKQAAILATTAFIKQRGSGALMVTDISSPVTTMDRGSPQHSGADWWQAEELLLPFRQPFVGY